MDALVGYAWLGLVREQLVAARLTTVLEHTTVPGPRDGSLMTMWLLGHGGPALPDDHSVCVAMVRTYELVGWAARHEGRVSVYVAPAWRQRGIGTRLVTLRDAGGIDDAPGVGSSS